MTQPNRCAAIYARVSTDKQSKSSTADQVRKCREYADAHGLSVQAQNIFIDEAVSGVGADRAELQRMMSAALAPAHPFAAILVDDTSRLSRNMQDTLAIFEKLNFAGIQLVAVSQQIDSRNDEADVLLAIHGLMDSRYVKELGKKTHRGLEGCVLRGLSAGGRCFGYDTFSVGDGNSKQFIVNENEAAIVRRIFESYSRGLSLQKIAGELNAEGVRPPRPRKGKRFVTWCHTGIREMLRRELYIGRIVWNRSRFLKRPGTNRRVRRQRPQSEWRFRDVPSLRIVSDELWNAVALRREKIKAIYANAKHGNSGGLLVRSATSPYLFSGLLRCGMCGGNLVIVTGNKRRHRRYGCSIHYNRGACENRMTERREWIEEKLLRELQEQVLTPEAINFTIEEFGRQLKAELAKVSGGIAKLRERKAQLDAELRHYAEAIASGVDVPAIVSAMEVRQRELDSITEKLLSAQPGSIEAQLAEIRRFVTSRVADLKALFSKDIMLARVELLKHVNEIRMMPHSDGTGERYYRAEGEWNLLGSEEISNRQMELVAGVGFEPTTSGL